MAKPPHKQDQTEKNPPDMLETDHLLGDLGERVARGSVIIVAGRFTRFAIQFVATAILARLLLPADFGLIAMAATLTGLAGFFIDFGLSTATVQRKDIDRETVSALFFMTVGVSLGLVVLLMALAPLAAWFFSEPRLTVLISALALPLPVLAASRQHTAILQRGMKWLTLEWTELAAGASAGLAAIILAWKTDLGYWVLVAQGWTHAVLMLILTWAVCPWRPGWVRDWHKPREAVNFGLHLTGFRFLNYFSRQFDDVLIGWRWGAADLGHYSRAYHLLTLPIQLINQPFAAAVIPALSRLQTDDARWREAFLTALAGSVLISCGISAVFIVCAESIVAVAFGPNWAEAGEIFLYLSLSLFAGCVFNTVGWIYISLGRAKRMMIWGLIATTVYVIGFCVGLPFGAIGVATAYSIAVWVLVLPGLWFATRKTPVTLTQTLRVVAWPLIAGLTCAAGGRILAAQWADASPFIHVFGIGSAVGLLYASAAFLILRYDPAFVAIKATLTDSLEPFRPAWLRLP